MSETTNLPPNASIEEVRAALALGYVGQVVMFCDRCGVEHSGDYIGESFEHRMSVVRREVANHGWTWIEGEDLCKDCSSKS